MQNEGRMNWEKVTRLWLLQTKSIGRKLSESPFTHLLCNLPIKLCKYLILNFGTFLEDFFWWKFFDNKILVEKGWKIYGGKCWWKYFVENIQWKLVCGKYSVKWEGTSRLGERVDCWGRVDWEGTRLLTRPTIVNLHLLLLKIYKVTY